MPGGWRKSRSYKEYLKQRNYWRKVRARKRENDASSSEESDDQTVEATSSRPSGSGASVSLRWDNRPQNEFGHVTASESSEDAGDPLDLHDKLMQVMDRSDSNESHTEEMLEILDKFDEANSKKCDTDDDHEGGAAGPSTIHLGQDEFGGEYEWFETVAATYINIITSFLQRIATSESTLNSTRTTLPATCRCPSQLFSISSCQMLR